MSSQDNDQLNEVWAARLELRLKKNVGKYGEGYRGAITTVLVRCESAQEYMAKAAEHLGREGFEINVVEHLSRLSMGNFEINSTVQDLLERTLQYPVQWTTFHLFKDDA
jgi:hypothetical protein